MSGIINQVGARSGIIGTTVGPAGMTLIESISGTDEMHTDVFTDTYSSYTLIIGQFLPASDDVGVYFRFLTSGTTELPSTGVGGNNYRGFHQGGEMTDSGANSTEYRNGYNDAYFQLFAGGGNLTNVTDVGGLFGSLVIHNPKISTLGIWVSGNTGHKRQASVQRQYSGTFHGFYNGAEACSGFRMWFSAGAIASQQMWLYGHKD